MNTRSPITTLSGQAAPARAGFRLTVITIFALHGVFLAGLLLQGCKPPAEPPRSADMFQDTNAVAQQTYDLATQTNLLAQPLDSTNQTVLGTFPGVVGTGDLSTATQTVPIETLTTQPTVTEYTVKSGDIPANIAKDHGVSLVAFMKANPGLEPRKLKVGQKVNIPTPAATTDSVKPETGGGIVHVVKSGENLTRIARRYGVTIADLRTANNLKTDRILVGQKLTVPAKAAMPDAGTTAAPDAAATTSPLVLPPAP